eukprot:gene17751-24111_t
MARAIWQLCDEGSCDSQERFLSDQALADSRGGVRHGSAGGRTRCMFCKLPGVGPVMAKEWYEKGFRSWEDVLSAVNKGQLSVSNRLQWALQHSSDLTEDVLPHEVEEMRESQRPTPPTTADDRRRHGPTTASTTQIDRQNDTYRDERRTN